MYPLIDTALIRLLLWAFLLLALLGLGVTAMRYWRRKLADQHSLVDRINALLPQTQCGACGFEGCLPYARAIANGQAINQCPPGGDGTIIRLGNLLNELPRTLNPAHGVVVEPRVAFIREDECIGCTKCIRACPVDAILGGPKLMHTVIARECTGCDLCVEPCPLDCIEMRPLGPDHSPRWVLPNSGSGTRTSLEVTR